MDTFYCRFGNVLKHALGSLAACFFVQHGGGVGLVAGRAWWRAVP